MYKTGFLQTPSVGRGKNINIKWKFRLRYSLVKISSKTNANNNMLINLFKGTIRFYQLS